MRDLYHTIYATVSADMERRGRGEEREERNCYI